MDANYIFLKRNRLPNCEFKQFMVNHGIQLQLFRVKVPYGLQEFKFYPRAFINDCRLNINLCMNDEQIKYNKTLFAERIITALLSYGHMKTLRDNAEQCDSKYSFSNIDPLDGFSFYGEDKGKLQYVSFADLCTKLGEERNNVVKLCISQRGRCFQVLNTDCAGSEIYLQNNNGDTMVCWYDAAQFVKYFQEGEGAEFAKWFYNLRFYQKQMPNPQEKYIVAEWIENEIALAAKRNYYCSDDDGECCNCSETLDICDCSEKDHLFNHQKEALENCCGADDDNDNNYCGGEDVCCEIDDNLKNENSESASAKLECKVCFERETNCLFSPCNHVVTCSECSAALKECPVCRKTIETKTEFIRA